MTSVLRAALGFPGGAALDYPTSRPGVTGDGQYYCVPLENDSQHRAGDRFSIPATSRDDADDLLFSLVGSDDALGGVASQWTHPAAADIVKARDTYNSALVRLKQRWIDGGQVYDEWWKTEMSARRDDIREAVRRSSRFEPYAYALLDKARDAKRRVFEKPGDRHPNGVRNRTGDVIKDTIDASVKPDKGFNRLAEVAGPWARRLTAISTAATAIELSASAAKVYLAPNAEQEEAALRAFYSEAGSQLGGFVGGAAGAALCAKVTFASGGIGMVTCGAIIGGLSHLGGVAGSRAATSVYRLIGPSTMRALDGFVSAPVPPVPSNAP